MISASNVAEIGALLGDPARVSMIMAMLDGRSWTASELAEAAGVSRPTASSHLGKLVAGHLVKVDRQGRHRYHRLASGEVSILVEQMHLAGTAATRPRATGPRDRQMRELRSCYDHLAGRIAVEVSNAIIDSNACDQGVAQLSEKGMSLLSRIGINLDELEAGRRAVCRLCVDWSERRPHVAGAVGAALLDRLKTLDWVRTRPAGRSLILTAAGECGLRDLFAIDCVRS